MCVGGGTKYNVMYGYYKFNGIMGIFFVGMTKILRERTIKGCVDVHRTLLPDKRCLPLLSRGQSHLMMNINNNKADEGGEE